MKRIKNGFALTSLFVALLLSFSAPVPAAEEKTAPPLAERIPKELTIHGHQRIDPYFWLRERENPKVVEYLKAENAYTEAMMKHTEKFQESLYNEMVGRMKQTDMSVPTLDNGYWYYTRFEEGKNYPVYCRKKGTQEAREEVLLNGNKMAEGHAYFAIGSYDVSPDNRLLAYSVDTVSRRQYKIFFKNLQSGKILSDVIPLADGNVVWAADNKTLFYALIDESLRRFKICSHLLGTPASRDREVYTETDETFEVGLQKSRSRQYVFVVSGSTLTSEYRVIDSSRPQESPKVFQPRSRGILYDVDHYRDRFYIYTNEGARNFKLMETASDQTSKEHWRELIPHRDAVLLVNFSLFKNYLVLDERENGLTQVRIIPWGEKEGKILKFPDAAYVVRSGGNPEPETDLYRFIYSSFTTPLSTYEMDMKTQEKKLLKRQEVLGGFKPEDYATERLAAPAYDGTLIPISLVYRKGTVKGPQTPLLIYGYGSYGMSMEPAFNSNLLSLLDRGVIYAMVHIRGGQEMGRYWYEEGKLNKKMNTFTDFISCAEYLVRHGYTSPEKMAAMGGSAGGLLMGAVVNLRPDLFGAVVAAVPFVDVVTTMLDASIPLTTSEYDEWGDPNKPEYYDYILSYSPYDNVRPKPYPALLVTTGLHDSQVQYWEPAKWVAKLRVTKTDSNPLLLKTNMEAGHGGASGRFRRLKETAFQYAFILDRLGIQK